MNILIIAPNPDDEVLGCGGTIVKHVKAGDLVTLCIATVGYTPDWTEEYLRKRVDEIQKVTKILGISQTKKLSYPTVKLDTIPQKEINNILTKLVNEVKPDIAYIPHRGDRNSDHRILHESSLVALRPLNHITARILSYEAPSVTEWGQTIEPFVPNVYVNITDSFEAKMKAMRAYESEIKLSPHPRSPEVIEALARKRGSEAGVTSAEAFKLIREIQK